MLVLLAFLPYPTGEAAVFELPHQNDSEKNITEKFGKVANFLFSDKEGKSLFERFLIMFEGANDHGKGVNRSVMDSLLKFMTRSENNYLVRMN